MDITLRPADEDDAHAVTAIINEGQPEPEEVDAVRERIRAARADGRLITRLVATDADGHVIGYGHALREDWMATGLYWVHVAVASSARCQGVGDALFGAARDWATARGATTFLGAARDNLPESRRFTERHGFRLDRHIFESTLDLAAFDAAPFTAAIDATRASGLRFLTMADAGDTSDAHHALWELERTVARDIPGGSESVIRPFEAFAQRVFDATGYRPELQFIAADGDTWTGLALTEIAPETNSLYNNITGVLPAWRGRGVAQALKLLIIRAAIQRGVAYLRTNNDAENAPMLAINRKLGYRAEPGYYRMRSDLTAPPIAMQAPGGVQ
ncbi:MAG TPA: GNAT family N-acetyltransferase [Ktedonobacterales bacterium]|nr:GNAT family N-acetyltransferase [Ktedonobacterales bacterium]